MKTVNRIGIVGMGHVGSHVANSLMLQGIADELVLCDIDEKKLAAEVQDLGDSLSFCPHNVAIENAGTEYEALSTCDVVVNAAGNIKMAAVSRDGELTCTTDICKTFAKRVVDGGFEGVWVTIANPCDVVATEVHRLTGYDPTKIVGSGTALDSARVRRVLSDVTGYDQHSIGAYMLGEHGFSQFVAWSNVNFGGKPLSQLEVEQPERFSFDKDALEQKAVKGGYVAMAGKGCTEYAVANAASRLVRAIVSNEHLITACGTLMTGQYGESGLWASLPCVLGANGVEEVIDLDLSADEVERFHASCAHIRENLEKVGL